jgi:hypothetical protein
MAGSVTKKVIIALKLNRPLNEFLKPNIIIFPTLFDLKNTLIADLLIYCHRFLNTLKS